MSYVAVAELRAWLGLVDGADDTLLTQACDTASAWIDEYCGESFAVASSATTRQFYADSWNLVRVDTFASTTGLVVATDDNDDGTAETTWTVTTEYIVDPPGRTVGEASGPFRGVRAVGGRIFPCSSSGRPLVHVTARWGWPATPAPVKQAAYLLAAEQWKLKEAPFGVAGFGEFGVIRVRANPAVAALLAPFRAVGVVA